MGNKLNMYKDEIIFIVILVFEKGMSGVSTLSQLVALALQQLSRYDFRLAYVSFVFDRQSIIVTIKV